MRRLYVRIYLHFLLIALVVWFATGPLIFVGTRAAFLHHFAQRLANHVASSLAPDFSSPDQLASSTRRIARDLGLDVTVLDPEGRKLVEAGAGFPDLTPRARDAIRTGPLLEGFGPRLTVSTPVRDPASGALLGIVQTRHHVEFHLAWVIRTIVGLGVVLGLIGLAALPLARRISRPVERLTEASRQLGAGQLAYRIGEEKSHTRSELGTLVHAWNEMADRIERQVRAQKELLANVSHELRSPLARIRVALEMLPQDTRLADILADLTELDRLIEDTLTTARLDAQALPLRRAPVQVDDLLSSITERARVDPLTQGKEVTALPSGLTVDADGALLKRALWNLVENAAKYGAPPVRLGATRQDGVTTLAVEDQGSGIADADLPRVFEPFYRGNKAHTPEGGSQGFGLGLTLARRIAEAHGGTIRAEPARPGEQPPGCRMVIRLPSSSGPTAA